MTTLDSYREALAFVHLERAGALPVPAVLRRSLLTGRDRFAVFVNVDALGMGGRCAESGIPLDEACERWPDAAAALRATVPARRRRSRSGA